MTSNATSIFEVFVWVWLPNEVSPVVAGRIRKSDDLYRFDYGRSYLNHADAIAIYEPELPLTTGSISPLGDLFLANCVGDSLPDAWGRRVITSQLGSRGRRENIDELDEFTFMLNSGSDRIGALDFQLSSTDYVPREFPQNSLETMLQAAESFDAGERLPPDLALVLQHATSVGGARPKVLLADDEQKYIAKFSQSTDTFDMIKAEYIAMRLARLVGLDAANVQIVSVMNRSVLLVDRFDRELVPKGCKRTMVVSALTLLGMHELVAARNAGYDLLGEIVRIRFVNAKASLRELFSRMVFNILVGNTDDHARNHSAFWHGKDLCLTPAYDICPQQRLGREASQGMSISQGRRGSKLSIALDSCNDFLLHRDDAMQIMRHQISVIKQEWDTVGRECELSDLDRSYLWRRQILNDFAFEGLEEELREVIQGL